MQTDRAQPRARIVLHGKLRREFGPEFCLGASNPARAIRMLIAMKPGFRAALEAGEWRVVRGKPKGGAEIDARGLHLRLPPSGEVHIFPAARGRASGIGVGKIILGVVMVAAAIALPEISAGLFGAVGQAGAGVAGGSLLTASTVFGTPILGSIALMGGAMILGGIANVISAQPAGTTSSTIDPKASFLLGGSTNVAQEGVPVPVVYGRTLVGSVVVSLGYEASAYTPPGVSAAFFNATSGWSGTGAGGGGKSGGGGTVHTPVEAPNSLQSQATVRIIDVLSEGPIGGLVDGPKSIFFDGTPLMASDGSWNFRGVSWTLRQGFPDQDPVPGYPASEETTSVNVQVKKAAPVTQTVRSDTANAILVTVKIPALFAVDSSSGDTNPTSLNYSIGIRPSRIADTGGFVGDMIPYVTENINGKCTSPYERSDRIDLPGLDLGANTWDIEVVRLTDDSTLSNLQNDLYFDLLTVITDHNLIYPDTAYIALTVDAASFGSTIPARTYLIDGREVAVPLNYDPVNFTYATGGPGTTGGTWDAISFQNVVTSNPAWILLDMLTSQRYGCGMADISLETTKADLFVISQYADGLVPDGFGGSERRYAVNAVITAQADAYTMLQTMVSAFRGMTYWGAGQVMVTIDMPKNPVKLVNQTNVINGAFDYQSTSLKTRHNVARVTWKDPSNQYVATPESVELTADIARRGVVATTLTAWGCTSRGLAHRLGKWLLYTEMNQTETITYDAGLYHLDLRPGDIFLQHDPTYFGLRWGGRLQSSSTQTVLQLDSLIDPDISTSFTATVVMPDNTVAHVDFGVTALSLSADGGHTILSLPAPLPLQPSPNAEWIIVDTTMAPRLFQAVGVSNGQPGRYSVTAVGYNPGKFDFVEFGIAFQPQVFSLLPALLLAALAPPSDVSATDYLVGVGTTTILRVTVSWTPATDARIDHYQVQVIGGAVQQVITADGASKDIDNLPAGASYTFSVRSVSRTGQSSVWVSAAPIVVDGKSDPPPGLLGLTAVGGTRRVSLTWQASPRRDVNSIEVQRAAAIDGAPSAYSTIAFAFGTSYLDADGDTLLPNTIWWYRVRAVTTTNVPGDWSNEVNAKTTLLIVDDLADGIINTAKFAAGLVVPELVNGVPTTPPGPGEAPMRFNTADGQLYTWNGSVWQSISQQVAASTVAIPAVNITGQLSDEQIASLTAAKISGQLTDAQLAAISSAKLVGSIVDSQLAGISAIKVSGQLSDSQLAGISAAKLIGSVVDSQIAGIGVSKLAGQLTDAQLAGISSSKLIGSVIDTQLAGISASKISGQLADSQIAAVAAGKLTGTITSTQIATDAITTPKIAAGAITAGEIAAGSVTASAIQAGAVTANAIQAGAITTAALAAGAVTASTIAADTITSAQIAAGAITASELAANSVTATAIQAGAVTANSLSANSVSATALQAGAVTAGKIATDSITATQIAAGAITASELAANSVTAVNIQAGAVTTNALAANSVTASQIAALAVTAGKIQANSITSTEIAANAITASELAAGAVTAVKLAAGAVTAQSIAAGAVTTEALTVGSASNLCWNSCLPQTADGWSIFASIGTVSGGSWLGQGQTGWAVTGQGSGYVTTSVVLATNGSQYLQALWDPTVVGGQNASVGVAWSAGQPIEVQALIMTHRCAARVQVDFYNAGGGYISTLVGNRVTGPPNNDGTMSSYKLSFLIGPAPAGAARARASIVGFNDGNSDILPQTQPPYIFFTQFAVGASLPNATQPSPWMNGGVATLAGGMLKVGSVQTNSLATNAITSDKINANAVTAGKIAAGAVIAGTIAANAVTAGTVVAGAIGASQIAAGQIRATHLAADFTLTQSAQIGTAVIGTAQIADLTVGTSKLAGGAVSNAFAVYTPSRGVQLSVWTDGSPIFAWWNIGSLFVGQPVTQPIFDILIDEVLVAAWGVIGGQIWSANSIWWLGAGWHTVRLSDDRGGAGGAQIQGGYLSALTVKR